MQRGFAPIPIMRRINAINKLVWGFTLIEIMVTVGIVAILITLITPSILRSRIVANESAAISNLKTIFSACQLYHINNGAYPGNLITLSDSTPPYIDPELGAGKRQRYEFVYMFIDMDHFTLNANPISTGLLKGRYFYTDESGIIRAKSDGPAGPNDEIIQ